MIKLSDYVVKRLEEFGVTDAFMLTGGSAMHLDNSFGNSDSIKYLCLHHEQACAMAAEAYAKFTGRLPVVVVTSGPGATNTITGLAGAYQDSVPCLFISGQAKKKQTVYCSRIQGLRQFGVQEINIIPIVESISKYAVMIEDPQTIRYHLEKALYLARTGRPGPVWLDIPLDVQSALLNEDELQGFYAQETEEKIALVPEKATIYEVLSMIKIAKRPVIIAGHGIRLSGACEVLKTFVETYAIPVLTPIMGVDILETESNNYIGRIGTKGTRAGNFAMQNSDLIISIGSRLSVSVVGHEYSFFAREAKLIVVDIDSVEHKKKTVKIDLLINADAKEFLIALDLAIKEQGNCFYTDWLTKCVGWKEKYPVCLPEYRSEDKEINYYYFIERLNLQIKKHLSTAPVISDAGSAFYVVSQAININRGQRYITSGALATMGFNLPAGIGVSIGNEYKPTIVITGEGSFQQNIQELQTIVHNNLPVKVFVVSNNGYLSIRQTQKRFFSGNLVGESNKSGISFPDTQKIASAYGIEYMKVTVAEELDSVIEKSLLHEGPVICEIVSLQDQVIMPTNSSAINKDGVMISKPLEDMFPFLDREEFAENMIVKRIVE